MSATRTNTASAEAPVVDEAQPALASYYPPSVAGRDQAQKMFDELSDSQRTKFLAASPVAQDVIVLDWMRPGTTERLNDSRIACNAGRGKS